VTLKTLLVAKIMFVYHRREVEEWVWRLGGKTGWGDGNTRRKKKTSSQCHSTQT